MKNKKFLAVAMLAGLTFGGLTATSVASAQYGGSNDTDAAEVEETDTEATETDGLLQVQDAPQDDADEGNVDGDDDNDGDRNRRRGGCKLEAAAAAIGIDEADLQAALEDGSTIAEVAEANGVAVDDVIDAMVEAKAEKLDAKVAEGRITQEEADEKLANAEERITDRVNGVDDEEDLDEA